MFARRRKTGRPRGAPTRILAGLSAAAVVAGLAPVVFAGSASAQAPVGQGFELSAGDLTFILDQIQISEQHAATATPADPCGTLFGPGPNQIPNDGTNGEQLPWGLRTVDGSCNNLLAGNEEFGASDHVFPRRAPAQFDDAEPLAVDIDGPGGQSVGDPTSYTQKSGVVTDSQPRIISNLIVDQTAANPAAVAAAGPDALADPTGTLPIDNVAPDTGLSAPFNSWFTLFGQFFDHGLDLVDKSGGLVFVPLQPDDPLIPGDDGVLGTTDDLPPNLRFMVMTRATNQPGPDGVLGTADDVQEHTSRTTSFVDQNQTYTSHPSHQVFLREYAPDATTGAPVDTGRLIVNPDDGMANWATVKAQAAQRLGIVLTDADALSVPMLATDAYGQFLPGPNGLPQVVTAAGLKEGSLDAPIALPLDTVRTAAQFIVDVAHHAVPVGQQGNALATDGDPGTTDDGDPATYDDELLNAHFIAGDGRVNENIGLTAVHHVFHSEHNRLVGDITAKLSDPAFTDPAVLAEWQTTAGPAGWDLGARLFQAARFVTEMEYQHLVFEEFARKVQPQVNLFGEGGGGYDPALDPTIKAEFAHAVYRFGHSMLTDNVARTTATGGDNSIGLIEAFLNPLEFTENGALTPEEAAGQVVRGMTRQVGQEIDEFVIEALRNNLLGLPLDLPTINMARARDTGIPTLNEARRDFFAESNGNSALAPYTSWADFSFNLKHRESLVNFVAAYGTHPSITGATTLATKRTAAELLIANDPDGTTGSPGDPGATPPIPETPSIPPSPADSEAFLNSTGAWANDGSGRSTTGLDDIDLWVGGLAEKQMVFGGLLGSTFNYVFELQMEDLQFGDRFYYLSRTAGMNLLVQLEGNSFAELIQRNTDVAGLPADSFSRPDFIFNVANLGTFGAIPDDPSTLDYDEGDRSVAPGSDLTRMPDGTIRYFGPAHVVFNGSDDAAAPDRIQASEGDDTIRGNAGNDRIEGGDGVDNVIGGLGDDIITDLFGDDVLKGGDGDDAISSGQGFGGDLNQGGFGKDFIVGGNDPAESFGGPDDDFVFAGQGEDTVFGDDGDDWIEGGAGPFNLLQGDGGNPFQDDPNGGHDVLDGDGGEQDFDAEGGDDIGLMGPGIQRADMMLGFDWATHKGDPLPADSDMNFTGLLPPSVDALRDRFDLNEALSGWDLNDVLRGDDRNVAEIVAPGDQPIGAGHALDQAGIDRIAGLQELLGAGVTGFDSGNIIIGGLGSDVIEGRGGDDVIDGDRWLDVQLRAPDLATGDPSDTRLVDTMLALQADVFSGRLDPGLIEIVRSIKSAAAGNADVDVAVFSGPQSEYTITFGNGGVTVAHTGGTGVDGTDRITNVETLRFADGDVNANVTVPAAPTITALTPGSNLVTVDFTPGADGGSPIIGFQVLASTGGSVVRTVDAPASATSVLVGGLTNGTPYTFTVRALNIAGTGPESAVAGPVTPAAPSTAPSAPAIGTAVAGNASATVNWTAPTDSGGSAITGYQVRVVTGADTQVGALRPATATATSLNVTGLTNGTAYRFQVQAVNAIGASPFSALSNAVTPAAPDTTAPTVALTSPSPFFPIMGRNSNVVVTFSEPVERVDGDSVQLQTRSGEIVPATVTYNAANRTATINPDARLPRLTQFQVVVNERVRDAADNTVAPTSFTVMSWF